MQRTMEQSRYLMWTRRKLSGSPHVRGLLDPAASPYNYSWEERAFAEDSAGRFGGCVWPPRSYSCSFCRREFRSAQALGGHMNVHRRDRARLKLSPNSQSEGSHHLQPQQQHHNRPNPCAPLADQPQPDGSPSPDAVTFPLPPLRVSAASTQRNYIEHTFVSPSHRSSFSLLKENQMGSFFSIPPSYPDHFSLRIAGASEIKLGKGDFNLREKGCGGDGDDDEERREGTVSRKRRRFDEEIPFLTGSLAGDGSPQSEVLGLGPIPVELDLELRLGDRPKVK
ncbi:unnamed protein product [Spirodela intermedia]|uniref:C2H2-type domain-containing protein n=2 Tax=Spirodela intermedia TaxID=51605 RepID=A0A7I8KJX7_SPIIN|nr:unnamed protein product [Spirodela intermedia]CAA6661727.1 unnamed protein product [Spirodela intermedia]CAA7398099.1 unnamed protein product [Spirodela intermedia]